ncbi:hypothetical protein BDN71DRAFT_1460696 [Pleurotus eryngii]|uniref:Uncharacterized protein n=1 Tax=Pleurotus eryngii TaxID=5323 RepID=A0A9P6DC84_PLEER|nr:hypothetical protein BDN71DRAFT_1460696 [Pleurotus eryngii]
MKRYFIGLSTLAVCLRVTVSSDIPSTTVEPGATEPVNITVFRAGVAFAPQPLPAPFAASKGECIVSAFVNIGRTTSWTLVKKIDFGSFVEPEGIVRIGEDRYFVSHNEYYERTVKFPKVINGTDRTPGVGLGFMSIIDGQGRHIARAALNEVGSLEYHNGGIDYDGRYIWANIAQYRPNSTSTLVRIDPLTLRHIRIAHFADHTGGPVHNTDTSTVTSLNWGSRNATSINLHKIDSHAYPSFTPFGSLIRNPSYFIDYQDCKFLGHIKRFDNKPHMFCGGLASYGGVNIGGLAVIDMETMVPRLEVPIMLQSENGWLLTTNPVDVDCVDGKLRAYFFPDQEVNNATLYAYEADPQSPFEFGGGKQ